MIEQIIQGKMLSSYIIKVMNLFLFTIIIKWQKKKSMTTCSNLYLLVMGMLVKQACCINSHITNVLNLA